MGSCLLGWQLRTGQKGRTSIGKTKRGKGTKVMLVADGEGLPIGLMLASAKLHEVRLAAATLQTVRVPRLRGRDRSSAPRNWSRTKPTTVSTCDAGYAPSKSSL